MKIRRILLSLLMVQWAITTAAWAQSLTEFSQTSGAERPRFIELYSSEGCSSCPPADGWLSGFMTSPGLWQDDFPLAFHVTYWDALGWRDPFGQKSFTERQYGYANRGQSSQVYTPQFMVNGREWRGWFSRGGQRTPERRDQKVGILSAEIREGSLQGHFMPDPDWAKGRSLHWARLYLALVGSGLATTVTQGENRHKVLHHDFVVLSLTSSAPLAISPVGELRFEQPVLPSPVQAGRAKRLAWVSWLELDNEPVQATGAWLEPGH